MKLFQPLQQTEVWRAPSVLLLVLANLVPLAGVMLFGWAVFPVMLLFWLENVVVGIFNALKMLLAGGGAMSQAGKLLLVPFFCVHYGGFTVVHGVFVFAMFGGRDRLGGGLFPTPEGIGRVIGDQHLWLAVLGLVISHGFSFGWNYLRGGAYREANLDRLMMQPYGRVVVLHVAILGGGFLIMALGSPVAGLALLIVLKIVVDLLAHVKQHALGREQSGSA